MTESPKKKKLQINVILALLKNLLKSTILRFGRGTIVLTEILMCLHGVNQLLSMLPNQLRFGQQGLYLRFKSLDIIELGISVAISFGVLSMMIHGIISYIKSTKSSKIKTPPGTYWLCYVDFFFSKKYVEATFKPLVGDWQEEYFEAFHQKRFWKARWINLRYSYAFFKAMGLTKIVEWVKKIASMAIT